MNIINNFRNIMLDDEFKVVLNKKNLNIKNYDEIVDVEDKKIIIKYNNSLLQITGNNLTIKKMIYDEILISGNIDKVIFL